MAEDERFRPYHRLRRKKEIDRVFREGIRKEGEWFRFVYLPKEDPQPRILIIAGRKVGKAVVRNRVKRAVREGFRKNKELFRHLDLVVIARPGIGERRPKEIEEAFLRDFEEVRDAPQGDTADQGRLREEEEAA